jgi:dephospho-CoA kinase
MKRPTVVGVVGGVASGKSEVTRHLERLGARVIHADAIGHEVLRQAEVIEILRHRFGDGIIDPTTGQIDRSKVAAFVFGNEAVAVSNRRFLENVVHPRIRERIHLALDESLVDPTLNMVVLDIPLLIESGWMDSCDRIVFVDASPEVRRSRAHARGWNDEQLQARENAQLGIDKKRAAATDQFENSGTLEELRDQVEQWWKQMITPDRG